MSPEEDKAVEAVLNEHDEDVAALVAARRRILERDQRREWAGDEHAERLFYGEEQV